MVVKVNNNGATIGNVETDIVQETIEVNAMLEDLETQARQQNYCQFYM